jgi:tetratricopeptide (TPR) repeat protein
LSAQPDAPDRIRAPLKPERTLVGALCVVLFAIYAYGACRTIYVGDSGELVTAVYLLGIPHPTGYPLYVLLGKLWTLAVPLGSIAWRMSLFSAAGAAAACGGVFLVARQAGLGRGAALFASLLLAFAPSFWAEANVQRVYALGALAVATAAWAAMRWRRDPTRANLALTAGICGLGSTNHTYMAVFALAIGLFAVVTDPRVLRRGRDLLAAAGAFAAGLLPYLYLPLRSRFDPALDWGNPESLDGLLAVVTRRDFWERRWISGPQDGVAIAADWISSFPQELGWTGAALALVGVTGAFARRREFPERAGFALLALAAMLGNLVVMGLHGSRSDLFLWHRYYIPSYLFAALLAAGGVQAVVERLRPLVGAARGRLLAGVFLALPLAQLVLGWSAHDRSRYRIAEDYSRRLLESLPPGADLAASDDNVLFVLLYLYHVEGVRPDVRLIPQGVGDANLPALRFDPAASRLYFTHHPNWNLAELDIVPEGLAYHVLGRGLAPRSVNLGAPSLDGEDAPRVPKDYLTRNLIGEFHFMRGVNLERTNWDEAVHEYVRAAAAAPDNDVLHYNLGLVYERHGDLRAALAAFERSEAINPRALPSASKVRAADKVESLRERLAR